MAAGCAAQASTTARKPSRRVQRRTRRDTSGRRLFAFDRRLGARLVAGADEAGRGCLAGPLVAAGVLFDFESLTPRELRALGALNDSKQHTWHAREQLFPLVLRSAARVAVVSRCVRGIDARGLHRTNLAALRDAIKAVTDGVAGEVACLLDGFSVPDFGRPQRAIVDGDATSAAIAAASIVEGHVIRNGTREPDRYIRPCANPKAPECNFPTPVKIPAGHWFMMGDNRGESDDSRFWGPVPTGWIVGGAFATYWPPDRIGIL